LLSKQIAGENGLKRWTLGEPLTVIVYALLELSTNRFDWQVSNEVFVIAVKGVVGTVMFDVPV